jgi:hypothetical protein
VTPVSVVEKKDIGALLMISYLSFWDGELQLEYLNTVFNNAQWKFSPDLGTILMINSL